MSSQQLLGYIAALAEEQITHSMEMLHILKYKGVEIAGAVKIENDILPLKVEIEESILSPLRVQVENEVKLDNSIIDPFYVEVTNTPLEVIKY